MESKHYEQSTSYHLTKDAMHLLSGTETNRAIVYSDPGTLKTEIVDLPIPKPGHGEILVRLYGSHSAFFDFVPDHSREAYFREFVIRILGSV